MSLEKVSLADQQARETAVDIRYSCIVSAPAGSGKTGLLTQRVLKLLGSVKQPEEILCITFTRKAAKEMHERIFDTLEHAEASRKKSNAEYETTLNDYDNQRMLLAKKALEQSDKYAWDLLKNKYRLKILTIDSFCKNMSSRLPFLSSMGKNPGIFDNPNRAYNEAVSAWLNDKINDDDNTLENLLTFFYGNVNRLTDLLVKLLSVREQWLPLAVTTLRNSNKAREYFESVIAEMNHDVIKEACSNLSNYEGDLCAIADFAAKQLEEIGSTSDIVYLKNVNSFANANDDNIQQYWLPLCNLLLTNDGQYRKSLDKRIGFPPGSNKEEKEFYKNKKNTLLKIISELKETPDILNILNDIRALPIAKYEDYQWQILNLVITILPELVAYLSVIFSKYQKADFSEYTLAALRALNASNGDITLLQKFDYQLNHILVDEFQDTSQPQLDLLNLLTQEWQPDDGRTVFLVGDGMQSCYAFRNANVGIFLNTKEKGLENVKLLPLNLSVNFRSTEHIIHWVNSTYSNLFPKFNNATKGAVAYSPSVSFHQSHSLKEQEKSTNDGVFCEYFPQFHDEKLNRDIATPESISIARKIAAYHKSHPKQSIAILARNRSQFIPIVAALNQFSIPYIAIDIDPLLSKTSIVDLLNLTKVIIDPSDRIGWIALLRSPWCALNFSDLTWLTNYDIDDTNIKSKSTGFFPIYHQIQNVEKIPNLSEDGLTAIQNLRHVLQSLFKQRQRRKLSSMIETAWAQLGGPYTLKSSDELNEIYTFLQRVDYFDKAGHIEHWQDFLDDINSLFAQPDSAQNNPVQLLTMHKSKGLEFDIVFLPSLDRIGRGEDSELLYWHEHLTNQGENHFFLSPIDIPEVNEKNEKKSSISKFIQKIKKDKMNLETMRLLYVASTRAKKTLHLSATLKVDENQEIILPAKNSLLAKIWPTLSEQFTVDKTPNTKCEFEEKINNGTSNDIKSPYIKRLTLTNKKIELSPSNQFISNQFISNQSFNNQDFNLLQTYQQAQTFERHQGVFIHRILKILCENGIEKWDEDTMSKMHPFWQTQLQQFGLQTEEIQTIIHQAKKTIYQLTNDKIAHWVLNNQHEDSACEKAIFWQGHEKIIDRTFIENDIRWIIDYKTSTPKDVELNTFIKKEKSAYKEQMHEYESVLRDYDRIHHTNKKLTYKKALYFVFIPQLITFD